MGGLAKHEWKKHGTCTGLSPSGYFDEALRALALLPGERGTPALIKSSVGGVVDAGALRASYAKRVAVKADQQCSLSEMTVCFAKQPDGRVGPQIDCPDHVMKGRDTPACARLRIGQLGSCLRKAKVGRA